MSKEEITMFVESVFKRMSTDNGYRARLSRASAEVSEWGAWETISRAGALTRDDMRRVYAICLSSMAESKMDHDGKLGLGQGFRLLQTKKNREISPRMRRLIAADSPEELCSVLGPALKYMVSKGIQLSYARLLDDLRIFCLSEDYRNSIKARWVEQFIKGEDECSQPE